MSNRYDRPVVAAMLVGLGGAIGVGLRYVCILAFSGAALWIINIVGSFCFAFLHEKVTNTKAEQIVRLVVMTGVLGSFTTFSSFSYEWITLMHQSMLLSILYAFCMTGSCIGAAYIGSVVGKR
ncbi:MAG: CrcB family protein [Caryophanon sp.]|nr:CrcB family protein [Caryophanon sp.]